MAMTRPAPSPCEQCACQPAGTGADLNDSRTFERLSRPRNARGQIEVEQEILAERFLGGQTVLANDLAQRRQVVDLGHLFRGDVSGCRRRQA